MKKKTLIWSIVGGSCFAMTLVTRLFMESPEDLNDFLLGMGTVFFVTALFTHGRRSKQTST